MTDSASASIPGPPYVDGEETYQTPQQVALLDQLRDTLESLREVGLCTTQVDPRAVEGANAQPGGLLGIKINRVVDDLMKLEDLSKTPQLQYVPIPMPVLKNVDKSSNPHMHTRRYVEIMSKENQRLNGTLTAVQTYRNELVSGLHEHFPALNSLPPATALPAARSVAADALAPAT